MAELAAVASIIQIADVGFRLSVKLFTFAETIANADKAIGFTSKDVSITSSVLKQVGEVLKKDQSFRTYSPEAIKTATAIVTECSQVFQEMDRILSERVPNISSNRGDRGSRATMTLERFKWPYWQPKIRLLRSNLDRLRSTLVVMLNVIIYQRMLQHVLHLLCMIHNLCTCSTEPAPAYASQEALIRDLIISKEKHIRKYEKLKRSITNADTMTSEDFNDSDESSTRSNSHTMGILEGSSLHIREGRKRTLSAADLNQERETNLKYIHHLMSLFDRLVREVNTPGYQIGLHSRDRIRLHVYKARSGEISKLYHLHGKTVIDQTLKIHGANPDEHIMSADFQEGNRKKQKRPREDRDNSEHIRNTRRSRRRRNNDLVLRTLSRPSPPKQSQAELNEYFIDGEGIHREVLQSEICGFLGHEAYWRPATYNV